MKINFHKNEFEMEEKNIQTKSDKGLRYSANPFFEAENVVINSKKRRVIVGKNNDVLLNTDTGEYKTTNVVSYKEVDETQFIKIFTQNITFMMGFNASGNKAFGFLLWAIQHYSINKDLVQLDDITRIDFLKNNSNQVFSTRTMYQGLKQLEEAKIIAKAIKYGFYYINPHFIFNGDRIRFITEIKRKKQTDLEDFTNDY